MFGLASVLPVVVVRARFQTQHGRAGESLALALDHLVLEVICGEEDVEFMINWVLLRRWCLRVNWKSNRGRFFLLLRLNFLLRMVVGEGFAFQEQA